VAGGIGIYKDISQQTRMEEELLLSQKLKAVGQLAGGVAHDFNNILGIIQGYSESLLEKMPRDSKLRESVDEILQASKHATALTRQLLAFSRKQVIQPQTLELNECVAQITKMLRRLIGEDVELAILPGTGLGRIKADPNQLEQVILNLAVNARDAMPKGGKLTIETGNVYLHEQYAATYAPVPPGRYVMLAVSDNGTGMSAETRAHIFDPFFTTKDKGKGTGLGLATVHGIVHQAGGYIRVDSELGAGSSFRVFFPRVDEEMPAPLEAPAGEGKILRGSETVLLLEDEPSFRKMIAEFLERTGYTVLAAESASEATRIAQLHPSAIHLMLTDVVMPEINGPQLARFLAVLRPDMRVLFMSGYTDGALEQKEILSKGVAFVQKPFAWSTLALKIRETLEVRAAPEESQHFAEIKTTG
jgi:nitrogen-specific signal transduction histidine kinase/ActR/RegA family two-component response regulator